MVKKQTEFNIFVVDDEETMRHSLAEILKLEGYQVQTASSGEEAIRILGFQEFDLILLDLRMPGKDGIDVLRFVTQNTPETQVVLLTAHGSMESAIEALRYGANEYLLKPALPAQILSSVAKGLEQRAELKHKQVLLKQLEDSFNALREAESREPGSHPNTPSTPAISIGNGIMVDLTRRQIWREDVHISLTPNEGKLMKVFLENPGQVFSHQELVIKIHGYEAMAWEATEVLRPLISRLRRKLSSLPGGDQWIKSIRGTGYVFDKPPIQ